MKIKNYLTFSCDLTRREVLCLLATEATSYLVIRQESDTRLSFTPRRVELEHCRAYLRDLEALRVRHGLQINGFGSLANFLARSKPDTRAHQQKQAIQTQATRQETFEIEFLAAI